MIAAIASVPAGAVSATITETGLLTQAFRLGGYHGARHTVYIPFHKLKGRPNADIDHHSGNMPDCVPTKRQRLLRRAQHGRLWRALNKARPGRAFKRGRNTLRALTWDQFVKKVAALPIGAAWRHNQAGDLPGVGNAVDPQKLRELVIANHGKRGFTYTHKPPTPENKRAIANANLNGFTINLSANNPTHADMLAKEKVGPVVCVLPADVSGKQDIFTPAGRRVVVCPATYRDDIQCVDCMLCQRVDRQVIVGFPAHGAKRKNADSIARA